MLALLNTLLLLVILLNLLILGLKNIHTMINMVSLQGVLLGLMPQLMHQELNLTALLISLITIVLKGILIPEFLFKAMRKVQIKKEIKPYLSLLASLALGALSLGLILFLVNKYSAKILSYPLSNEFPEKDAAFNLLIPTSLATIVTGFLLIIGRAKAISQVLGYLVLENGIFIFGLLLVETMPLIIELGILLDLFVAIFITSIIIHHINQEFSSLDTRYLSILKD